MAGDWIKLDSTTPMKPEVFCMADQLGIDPDAVVGKLIRVWIWADQQTLDGNAGSVTKSLLDRITSVAGFADAMVQCGWLVESEHGLTFPNFDRHNGKTAKTRALSGKRVEKHRNAASVTNALPEKRREEIKKTKQKKVSGFDPRKPELPSVLHCELFVKAWQAWCDHRGEIRKPLTKTSVDRQMETFAEWGAARSVRAIDYTITKGWQGIREREEEPQCREDADELPPLQPVPRRRQAS